MDKDTFQSLIDELMRFYNQRDYAGALALVEQKAGLFPEQIARTTFWRMCLLSLCNRPGEVLSVFQQGLDAGLWWVESQFRDPDLDAVRGLPEFKELAAESHRKCMEARKHIEPDRTLLVPDDTSRELPLLIALHGRNGHKDSNLEHWEIARRRGWLVLSPQSRQAIYQGAYCWDDNEQGLTDILFHVEETMKAYGVDRTRIVTAGFSQGSGMAIYAALSGRIGARGFIGVGTFMAEPECLIALARQARSVRGYFITGEKDHTLEKARAIQKILKEHHIQFGEEVHAGLGHEFPADFGRSFENALRFILEA
ncbi:MAG: dienelactone hydrolase family protein [Chloroflexota bacterium]